MWNRYDGYHESFDSRNLVQIYARAKANLSKGKISPFLQFDAGYSLDLNYNKDAGTAIYASVGYYMQGMSHRKFDLSSDAINSNTSDVMGKGLASQFTFRIGLKF